MPRNFYSKIFDSFDREFQKKFKSLSSKYEKSPFTQKNTTKIKYDLSNLIGLKVLDCSTNSVIETESTITFAYILLNLALYPLDKKNMPLWNEHVKLFDEAERSNFNEYSVEKLHIFLTKNFFFEHEDFYSYVSIENLKKPLDCLVLLIIHLDVIVSAQSKKSAPICFNHIFKVRNNKNGILIRPSTSFADLILIGLESNYRNVMPEKIDTRTHFDYFLTFLDSTNEEDKIKLHKLKHRMRKIRAGEKCYLNDALSFFNQSINFSNMGSDELYLSIAERNSTFIKENIIPSDLACDFANFHALWLIYIFHYLIYEELNIQKKLIPELIKTQELKILWKKFKAPYKYFGHSKWPKEFQETMNN